LSRSSTLASHLQPPGRPRRGYGETPLQQGDQVIARGRQADLRVALVDVAAAVRGGVDVLEPVRVDPPEEHEAEVGDVAGDGAVGGITAPQLGVHLGQALGEVLDGALALLEGRHPTSLPLLRWSRPLRRYPGRGG
jgi:hypothetical protein